MTKSVRLAMLSFCFLFLPLTSIYAQTFAVINQEVYQGDVVVVRINPQWQGPMICISALGKQYVPNKNGYVLIGVGVDVKPAKYAVLRVECGRGVRLDQGSEYFKVLSKNFIKTRVAGKGRSNQKRKGSEKNAIDKAFSVANRSVYDLTGGVNYANPLADRNIIDSFGLIYSNNKSLGHFGVDLGVPVGTPVTATNFGKVVLVARSFVREGNMVILNHGLGIFSVYMHLSRIDVDEGDAVVRSQIIGLSGETGAGVREPHLHFNIKIHDTYIDPLRFIDTVDKYLQ
jgi:murein DD-endopeptidase MepM/ murein hydrolase activator NlpD